jgi:hypothetical protein
MIKELTPTSLSNYYYNLEKDECWRSIAIDTKVDQVEKYSATTSVTLEWKFFEISGEGSMDGFNVYRRMSHEKFDYYRPINKELISNDSNQYVDSGKNSIIAPVPKTVYYYEVRPVVNSIPTDASEPYKTIRLVSPPDNMVFVHRWIVNMRMCELMHQTPNILDNFNCPYIAPGAFIVVHGPWPPCVLVPLIMLVLDLRNRKDRSWHR